MVNQHGCRATATVTVIFDFDACVGIGELPDRQSVRVYPNPSTGLFNLLAAGFSGEVMISVLSLNGLEVYTETIVLNGLAEIREINLQGLPKGMYYLRLLGSNIQHTEKILVK